MLELRDIKKDYYIDKKPFTALKGISLAFPDKGFISILGASGCGKTTLLNIIGGLDHYTSGDLIIDGKSTKDFVDREWDSYRNERVGFVFQSYNLIPHMNVISNVEISLMLNGVSRAERYSRSLKALELVGLKDEAKKRPNQLSGGQMQRVALARALVNNPKIVLADEPTGALDSVTSVQVLDLLKEAAKTRLVIMVTHNRELADCYSDRIIEMADGLITKDSMPMPLGNVPASGKEINKKTSMSFATALKSSFTNIKTKKGRTILTAVASSFGIIGVALVLALSNGFSNYVHNVEASVASAVPITITPLTSKYSTDPNQSTPEEYPSDGNLHVPSENNAYVTIHRNNYGQDYFDYINKVVDLGYASTPLYNRVGLDYHLLTNNGIGKNKDEIINVNAYKSAGSLGSAISSVTALPTYVFHELYGTNKDLNSWYDVLDGQFPTNKNEVALITDRYNQVDRSTLKALGLLSESDLVSTSSISFDEFVGKKTFKVYRNCDWYKGVERKSYNVNTHHITGFDNDSFSFTADDSTDTLNYYNTTDSNEDIYKNKEGAVELTIVGVLRPSATSYINLMPSSVAFTSELKDYLVEDGVNESSENKALDTQLKKDAISSLYMKRDDSKTDGLKVLNGFLEDHNPADPDKGETHTLSQIFAFIKSGQYNSLTSADTSKVMNFFTSLESELPSCFTYRDYWYSGAEDGLPNNTSLYYFLFNSKRVGADLLEDKVTIPSASNLTSYLTFLERLVEPSFFSDVNDPNRTNWTAIDFLALEDQYSLITSILIFPTSLTTKEALSKYLDAYNKDNDGNDKPEDEQIWYSDIMSTFTGSLGVLINVITTVLIVFAAISLVVSSIMTGIITYVSVIERTKEIGILRACGARKKDVGRLFEAECVIVGTGAGLIGILITWIACFPISTIIDNLYPGNNLGHICELSPIAALILLALSIVLALISGLIPARLAAKKDPVTALRTE